MNRAPVAALIVASLWIAACTPSPQPAAPTQAPTPAQPATPAPAPVAVPPATAATADAAPPVAEDWTLPGRFSRDDTRDTLQARFGKDNFRSITKPGAEGMGEYEVLVLYPDDPRKRLEITFTDASQQTLESLTVEGEASQWQTAGGIRPGMTLAELVALNGKPISFYGLAWDYGGTVQDWHGGKLANPVGGADFHAVILGARAGIASDKLPAGDGTFRSDDRKWPGIGKDLVVSQVGISWPEAND